MLDYFRRTREALVDDGILLFLDVFGGSECYQTQKEKRKLDGFQIHLGAGRVQRYDQRAQMSYPFSLSLINPN